MPLKAQTTGAISWELNQLEISTDGPSTWTDVSGSTNQVDNTGGDVSTAVAYTHTQMSPLVGYGPAALREVHITGLYTDSATEAFELLRAAYKNRTDIWVRYTPKGVTTGNKRYVTDTRGRITKFKEPSGSAGDAKFVTLDATWTGATMKEETV